MPVITVTGPLHRTAKVDSRALMALGNSIARALDLPLDAVYTTLCPSGPAVLGGKSVEPWTIILIHGSKRAPSLMSAAIMAARQSASELWANRMTPCGCSGYLGSLIRRR
jgi:hypothetical protein